jgi:transcription-repair coupling factor (superfamily II helicase)
VTHPAIRDLLQSLARDPAFQDVVGRLIRDPSARVSFSGVTTTAKALYLVLLWQATERNVIVVVDGNKQADTLGELVETFFDLLVTSDIPRPQTIPALDVLPAQRLSPHNEISEQRASGLWRLASRKTTITITPVASALLRTEAAEFYRQLALPLRVGEEIPLEDVLAHLESIGYERRDPVEMVGEYSLRGGVLDIFPAETAKPVRLELFGDLIESIRRFDVETQRSVMRIAETTLLPLAEYPKSRELLREIADQVDVPSPGDPFPGWEFLVPLVRPRSHSLFSLAENPLVVVDEP